MHVTIISRMLKAIERWTISSKKGHGNIVIKEWKLHSPLLIKNKETLKLTFKKEAVADGGLMAQDFSAYVCKLPCQSWGLGHNSHSGQRSPWSSCQWLSVFLVLTLSGVSGQTDIQRNSISDIPMLLFPQVHITEGVRWEKKKKTLNNVIWNLGGS